MPASRAATANRSVLEAMSPGISYEAREIAVALGITVSIARHVLARLAKDRRVERIEPVWRGLAVEWMRRG